MISPPVLAVGVVVLCTPVRQRPPCSAWPPSSVSSDAQLEARPVPSASHRFQPRSGPRPRPQPGHGAKAVKARQPADTAASDRCPRTPVIAVKIDDTAPGRPATGHRQGRHRLHRGRRGRARRASIGDLRYPQAARRLCAQHPSERPRPAAAVRQDHAEAYVRRSPHDVEHAGRVQAASLVASTSWSDGYFGRTVLLADQPGDQSSYINLALDLTKVCGEEDRGPTGARSIGWTFVVERLTGLADCAAQGQPTSRTTVTGSYSGGTPVRVPVRREADPEATCAYIDVDPSSRRPLTANTVATTNVIVAELPGRLNTRRTLDVNGNPSAVHLHSIGRGTVLHLFRQRQADTSGRGHAPSVSTAARSLRDVEGRQDHSADARRATAGWC